MSKTAVITRSVENRILYVCHSNLICVNPFVQNSVLNVVFV